ncbi:hypothetical protein MRX96_017193 [Rhipicephalus microplus]
MASMSRATVYRRISHAVQADVHAILVAAGEGINAEENLSPIAFNPSQPEVPKPPPYRSLGPVSSAGVYGGLQESVEYQSGVFFGECKPSQANAYLRPFVDDPINLLQEGLVLESKNFAVLVGAIICDSPAKSVPGLLSVTRGGFATKFTLWFST